MCFIVGVDEKRRMYSFFIFCSTKHNSEVMLENNFTDNMTFPGKKKTRQKRREFLFQLCSLNDSPTIATSCHSGSKKGEMQEDTQSVSLKMLKDKFGWEGVKQDL